MWEISRNNTIWNIYCNGGDYRKYYGNEIFVINWSDEAINFYESQGGLCNEKYWNKEGITWSLITSAKNSFRIKNYYSLYSSGSPTIFNKSFSCDMILLSYLNSPISHYYLKALNPTLNTTVNDIFSLPFLENVTILSIQSTVEQCITLSKTDWDSYETSWDFKTHPLLLPDVRGRTLRVTYANLRARWQSMSDEMHRLEEENNRLFIEAYGLQDELTPDVPLNEITLTCNPAYRNQYVRGYRQKLEEKVRLLAAGKDDGGKQSAADQKNEMRYSNVIQGLRRWENEMHALASERVEIDLDDGVRVNYPKFGSALKKIPGLADKDE